jgi:hypothetical protein
MLCDTAVAVEAAAAAAANTSNKMTVSGALSAHLVSAMGMLSITMFTFAEV